ncbi:hypothetical protein NQ317_003768, partial [Molorchus minor]
QKLICEKHFPPSTFRDYSAPKKRLNKNAVPLKYGIDEPALLLNGQEIKNSCTVTSFSQVDTAVASCSDIVISGIDIPAGVPLRLDLNNGTKLTFDGRITFGFAEWDGPVIYITGHNVTIEGAKDHVLDGQGDLWWDGLGGQGRHFEAHIYKNRDYRGLHGWVIDCSDGDKPGGGHNTDGFGVKAGSNVVIQNAVVKNQDDCIVVNYGSNYYFSNISCSGSHGLSLSVGQGQTFELNTVSNVTFIDSSVANSENGIHVKTHGDGGLGVITDVTYQNIKLSGIINYGINIQEDYVNGTGNGTANNNVPIRNLKLINIEGTVGETAMPIYIYCADEGCFDWEFSNVSVTGGSKDSSCNFTPEGFTC